MNTSPPRWVHFAHGILLFLYHVCLAFLYGNKSCICSKRLEQANPQLIQLQIWATNNEQIIAEKLANATYTGLNPALLFHPNDKITPIAEIQPKEKIIWIKGSILIHNIQQKFWYMACKNCYSSTSTRNGESFPCINCKEVVVAEPRCAFKIEMLDDFELLPITPFGPSAENILLITTIEVMKLSEQDKFYIAQIRQARFQQETSQMKYNLYCLFEEDGLNQISPILVTEPNERNSTAETSTTTKRSLHEKFDEIEQEDVDKETASSNASIVKKSKVE